MTDHHTTPLRPLRHTATDDPHALALLEATTDHPPLTIGGYSLSAIHPSIADDERGVLFAPDGFIDVLGTSGGTIIPFPQPGEPPRWRVYGATDEQRAEIAARVAIHDCVTQDRIDQRLEETDWFAVDRHRPGLRDFGSRAFRRIRDEGHRRPARERSHDSDWPGSLTDGLPIRTLDL